MLCRVHSWLFNEPYYAIDEGFDRFDDVILPLEHATVYRIALFHYVVKCVQWLVVTADMLQSGNGAETVAVLLS